MTTTAPPENANAAQQRTAPRETRTNENLTKDSRSTAEGKRTTLVIKRLAHRGEGLNDSFYRRAFRFAMEGVTARSAAAVLHDLAGHEAKPGEIQRQVERAYTHARGKCGSVGTLNCQRGPAWPLRDDGLLARFWEDHPATVDELAALSPHRAPDHPLDVLRALHGADDDALLCLGVEPTGPFSTRSFSQWEKQRGQIERWEMCVPNLMRSEWGMTKDTPPQRSQRCRDNACEVGAQRFLVVEFDLPPHAAVIRDGASAPDVCAALILHKIGLPHVRMVVHSASKSLHAWIETGGRTAEQIARFYRTWCLYGGDWRGSLPEQQFRLPGGWRADKNAAQRVVYWHPEGGR
jgi:hypothetical protein